MIQRIRWRLFNIVDELYRNIIGRMIDRYYDRALVDRLDRFKKSKNYNSMSGLKVLVVGVQSPRRPGSLEKIFRAMASDKHQLTFDAKGVETFSKFENTNILLSRHDLQSFDWVIMTDDDIEIPENFIDVMLGLAEHASLKICGPAQREHSYWSHQITRRQKSVLLRETNFAEIGPVIAFRREVYDLVFPLPELKYGWGVDIVWPVLARQEGWKVGIIDAVAIRHVQPIGKTYNFLEAKDECEEYMGRYGIVTGVHVLETYETVFEAQ